VTYLSGTTTELVWRNDILHMAFSRFDLFDRGWTDQQIKYDLGTPDFRVRVGKREHRPGALLEKGAGQGDRSPYRDDLSGVRGLV
jgi:hypothetical protein